MTGWTDEERKAIHDAARFSEAMTREEAVEEAIEEAERILAVRLASARKEARPEIAGWKAMVDKHEATIMRLRATIAQLQEQANGD